VKLPNAERVFVPPNKLTEYLLSTTHPSGRSKAAFFARFGFSRSRGETLSDALRSHARDHDVTVIEETPFGTS
jgi:N-acetylglutamate synthase-like GNAT family acetyltransferase